jgi:WD40 repeat protein
MVAFPAAVWGMSWAPDSRRFAAASVDSVLRIVRGDGTLEREVRLEASGAYCVSWSPCGPRVAAGLSSGAVLVLDAETGGGSSFPVSDGSEGLSTQIIALAWSPDGRRIAAGGMDFVVRILDPETGKIEREFRAPGEARKDVNGLAWSPDGTRIAVCQQDGRVRIWNAGTGVLEAAYPQAGGWLRAVAWSPDGRYLATAGNGRDIAVRDGTDGRILATLPAHRSPVWSLAWSPDGSRLASGSGQYATAGGDCSIRIWDVTRE